MREDPEAYKIAWRILGNRGPIRINKLKKKELDIFDRAVYEFTMLREPEGPNRKETKK